MNEATIKKYIQDQEKVLIFFEDLYNKMNEYEKRQLISILISEIHVHEERTANGQWLNEIVFALPIISTEKVSLSLNNGNTDETIVILKKEAYLKK